jgi:DNA adenine methylase
MSRFFASPLRYPGGKGKIADFFKLIFEKNSLIDGYYVEPYAGGSSVALSLLLGGYASKIVINDYDRSIYAFWYSTLNETEELCRMIHDSKVNMSTWKKQKEIQRNKAKVPLLELGYSTFFLNRTNRSGVIKAGVIGGNDQSGNYKIDARFNKSELIQRVQLIAKHKKDIKLFNLDACALIKKLSKTLPEKTLFYFDPPYYVKGKELYVNYYNHENHVTVARMITNIKKHKWVVSYDNAVQIRELYKLNNQFEYSFNYSMINATKGTEVIIYSDNLYVPENINPTKVEA